jgi:transcriptional regulator with XRE-family HTH domain
MKSILTLLDAAAESCKTQRELAARLGIAPPTLQAVLKGRRHLTPGQAVALANLVNLDPRDVLAQCVIEREDDKQERGRLQEAFFPRGILGAVALCFMLATPDHRAESKTDPALTFAQLSIYTLCAVVRATLARLIPGRTGSGLQCSR